MANSRKMYANLPDKLNEELTAVVSGEGAFAVVPDEIMGRVLAKSQGVDKVSPSRRAQLDPGVNSPYKIARSVLKNGGSPQQIISLVGPYAAYVAQPDKIRLRVYPFVRTGFTDIIAQRLKKDMGGRDEYCVMVWQEGDREQVLAAYYQDVGLVPAPGITGEFARRTGLPFLTENGSGGALWLDPMLHMTDDRRKRLELVLKNTFPAEEFPGMRDYIAEHLGLLARGEERRLMSLVPAPAEGDPAVRLMGLNRYMAMTPAGYLSDKAMPEVFAHTLAVIQDSDAPYMGGRGILNGTDMAFAPPLTRELLDSDVGLVSMSYEVIDGNKVRVTALLDMQGEEVSRERVYTLSEMADISALPNMIQMYHMNGVSDEDWNGRFLLVTGQGAQNAMNLEEKGIPLALVAHGAEGVRPNGVKMEGYEISSRDAGWVTIPTGKQTRYVSLYNDREEELAILITPPAAVRAEPAHCSGKGYISLDCGTTTTHVEMLLDDSAFGEAYPLEVTADELCQRITPMSGDVFRAICSTVLLPDIVGPLHPTAAERFISAVSPALINMPNVGGRLLPYSSDDLASLMRDKKARGSLFINMKAGELSADPAVASANRQAYSMAIASYIQLGYLHALSRGQRKIEVLFAYPKGLRSNRVFTEAIAMVEKNTGRPIAWQIFPESQAAGAYIKARKPDGLPMSGDSPLVVADLGGMSIDVDVSVGGVSVSSASYGYASIVSQLSAALALMRAPHALAVSHWGGGDGGDIIRSLFSNQGLREADSRRLADSLIENVRGVMASGDSAAMLDLPYNEGCRKLLEQLFRTTPWDMPMNDGFISHWFQLWAMPIMEIVAQSLKNIDKPAAIVAFVGSGSLFLKGMLERDEGFKRRALELIRERSGVMPRFAFVAEGGKPEVSKGMLIARQLGMGGGSADIESDREIITQCMANAEGYLPEGSPLKGEIEALILNERAKVNDAKLLAVRCVAASLTKEDYDSFVKEIAYTGVIDGEEDENDAFGLGSVCELMRYTDETMEGYDSFEALVEETLERFPAVADNGEMSRRMLLFMLAFNIANRNLHRAQLASLSPIARREVSA